MAFKGQKKGLEVADDTSFPNSFNDFHLLIASTVFSSVFAKKQNRNGHFK